VGRKDPRWKTNRAGDGVLVHRNAEPPPAITLPSIDPPGNPPVSAHRTEVAQIEVPPVRAADPFFDMAYGSAGEIRGALDLADAWAGRSRASRRVPCSIASWVCCRASPR
jgi:hypothetical protein